MHPFRVQTLSTEADGSRVPDLRLTWRLRHRRGGACVTLPGYAADLRPLGVDGPMRRRHGPHGEWAARLAIDQQAGVSSVLGQHQQIARFQRAAELLGQGRRVLRSDSKHKQAADVSEHGGQRLFGRLGQPSGVLGSYTRRQRLVPAVKCLLVARDTCGQ